MEPTLKYTRVPNNPTCILVESFHSHLEHSNQDFLKIVIVLVKGILNFFFSSDPSAFVYVSTN